LGIPEDRLFIAQNTIDTVRIGHEVPRSLEQKQGLLERLPTGSRFVFGYLGSLVPRKSVERIVSAFNRVRGQGYDAVLVIAGGGPSEESVRKAAVTSAFTKDIFLVGRVPIGEEGGYFQLFDAFLSFSQGGLGILEAMANGRAVLSTPERFPETELLVNDDTGLISTDLTVEAFAARMVNAIERREDLAAIGARAQSRVLAEATLENMVIAIDQAVRAAVARHAPRSLIGMVHS
jgi:glycosyltransferase involved in cell wall biosynthesis